MKKMEKFKKVIGKLDSYEDILDDPEIFFSQEQFKRILRTEEAYYEKVKAVRPTSPEDAIVWDRMLHECQQKIKALKKAGEKLAKLEFATEDEKQDAVRKAELFLTRLKNMPVREEKK